MAHAAIVAIGKIVHRHSSIMAFSTTFAVVGGVLVEAAIALIFTRKSTIGGGARRAAIDASPNGLRNIPEGGTCD